MVLDVISPCKLNLFLYITGKRADGYHNLQTLFVVLDYGDRMHFEITSDPKVELLTDFGFDYHKNLIYRAADLLMRECHPECGVKISIEKILPQGGGIGGGSGNAATTLLVLNKLWQLNLSEDKLIEYAAKLGADVPIFIKGKTCFAQGIGEILTEVSYPDKYYLVANPGCSVPTAELFASNKLKKDSPVRSYEELLKLPFENAFTPVVQDKYPEVKALLERLSTYGTSFMTGSGASCCVGFDTEDEAQKVKETLLSDGIKCFVAKAVEKTSLQAALEKIDPLNVKI